MGDLAGALTGELDPAERERILDRAKRYPYRAPPHSFVLIGDRELELFAGGNSLADRRARDPETGREIEPGDLADRRAVLAYGANRTAEALARKRALPDFPRHEPIVVLRARLADFDVVYSAHISPYGSIGATLARSEGTEAEVCVLLLTGGQLAALGDTEPNYTLEELSDLELSLEHSGRLERVLSYVSRHGCLVLDGSETALTAISATGRRLPERSEPEVLAAAAERLGHRGALDAFILENVADSELATARTRELRRDARRLAWPTRPASAG